MSRLVTVTGADRTLFDVAARELGDPLAWWRIAQASGLSDPWLVPQVTVLTVPTDQVDSNGGNPDGAPTLYVPVFFVSASVPPASSPPGADGGITAAGIVTGSRAVDFSSADFSSDFSGGAAT